MKRGKKGITQVDWVVSFAIFFLYLAWFFVFIRPITEPPRQTDSELSSIQKSLLNDASWTVNAVPAFVDSNLTLEDEPIIIEFPFSWSSRNTGFRDGRDYYLAERKLFFLANLSNVSKNIFWMVNSAENYTTANISRGLIAGPAGATIDSAHFSATFKSSVPESIHHSGNVRMSAFNISHGGSPVLLSDYESDEFNKTFMLARYAAKTGMFNASFYIFASNPRIYGYAYSNSFHASNFTITATLHNYTSYYAHDSAQGPIASNETCTFFASNYVDLYDGADGIAFFTRGFANGSICGSGGKSILSLTFAIANETSFIIQVHKGDYRNTTKYIGSRSQELGMVEQLSGISLRLLNDINKTNYEGLKRNWSYSPDKDFAFFLFNASEAAVSAFQPIAPPVSGNVYVSRSGVNTLDKNGNKKRHTLLIRGW